MDPSLVIVHDLDGIEIIPEEPTEKTISWIEDILQSDYSQANILSFCPIASAVAETLLTGRGLQSQARELLVTIQKEREETNVCSLGNFQESYTDKTREPHPI